MHARTWSLLALVALACRSQPTASGDSPSDASASERSSALGASGTPLPRPAPTPIDSRLTGPEWTAGIAESKGPIKGISLLSSVRAARHEGFDRVVFEFKGELPNYHVEYVDKPVRKCGSGEATLLEGDGWLSVAFEPANAHTEAGAPTVTELEQHPNLPIVRELELTCDFEAHVTWVAGVASPNRYRISKLSDPTRFVVDIRH